MVTEQVRLALGQLPASRQCLCIEVHHEAKQSTPLVAPSPIGCSLNFKGLFPPLVVLPGASLTLSSTSSPQSMSVLRPGVEQAVSEIMSCRKEGKVRSHSLPKTRSRTQLGNPQG